MKYVKCIKEWTGSGRSKVGKIYNTSISPPFSSSDWETIFDFPNNSFSDYKEYFIKATEEEWNKQEGITTSFEIPLFVY